MTDSAPPPPTTALRPAHGSSGIEIGHPRERSFLRELVGVVSRPGILSLAGGFPATELLPREALAESYARVLSEQARSLQYAPQYGPLTERIVSIMAQRGVDCREDQVLVTSGAQQGIRILTELLLQRRRTALVERVVYTGLETALEPLGASYRVVGSDLESGIDPDDFERCAGADQPPAFLYVVPDAGNPTGVTLTADRRRPLCEAASRHGVPIIEDDPYGFLTYDHAPLPPLRSLDEDWVLYLGSFSKIISPALRLGWMVVPPQIAAEAAIIKDSIDLESSALTQRVVVDFLEHQDLAARIDDLRDAYRGRRDAMLSAIREHFPSEARWSRPDGGFFVWVELPGAVDTRLLLDRVLEQENIAFVPGQVFAAPGTDAGNCLRLSFPSTPPEQIHDAIRRLAAWL